MQGLVNWKAIRDLRFASMTCRAPQEKRENAGKKAEGGGVDWDEVANMYNEMTRMEARSTAQAISLLPIGPEDSVLDVGCGPGRLIVPLAKIARSVTGVDAFAQMLSFARQNAQNAGLKNIKFLQKSWLDEDTLETIGKHDIVIASRSVGLGDIEKLNKIAKKFVVLCVFSKAACAKFGRDFCKASRMSSRRRPARASGELARPRLASERDAKRRAKTIGCSATTSALICSTTWVQTPMCISCRTSTKRSSQAVRRRTSILDSQAKYLPIRSEFTAQTWINI